MNITTTFRRAAATSSIVLALGAVTILPAAASHGGGGGVEQRGNCSGSTDWDLKAKAEDGRIEVEAEIDSNVNGQVWTWRILHNGGVSAKGRSTTHAPSGSFEIRRLLVNSPGTDAIGLRSTNTVTGETCAGNLQF
jgi:hypothetical protein